MRTRIEDTEKFQKIWNEFKAWSYRSEGDGDLEFCARNDLKLWGVYLWQDTGASEFPGVKLPSKRLEAERRAIVANADIFICQGCSHHAFLDAGDESSDEIRCTSCGGFARIEFRGGEKVETKSKAPYQIHLKDGTFFEFETYAEYDEVRCQLSTGDYHTATFVTPKTKKSKKSQIDTSNVIFVDFVNRRKVS